MSLSRGNFGKEAILNILSCKNIFSILFVVVVVLVVAAVYILGTFEKAL